MADATKEAATKKANPHDEAATFFKAMKELDFIP